MQGNSRHDFTNFTKEAKSKLADKYTFSNNFQDVNFSKKYRVAYCKLLIPKSLIYNV